jgi:hypothetical protein
MSKPRKDPGPLEKVIERKVCDSAEARGIFQDKFTSPACRANPDRIFICSGVTFFIEFKRLGKKPTKAQALRHKAIRAAGGTVHVIDNVTSGLVLIQQYILTT